MSPYAVNFCATAYPQLFPLSVVILARNEAVNIEQCVNAVTWCNDVVVVDDGSTDATAELARALGARVVQHSFVNFAEQRNWAMDHAGLKNEWVLHLDADEVVTDSLRLDLIARLTSLPDNIAAFRMCRKTMFQGRWMKYSDGFPVWIMRLVRKGRGRFISSGHGEVAVPDVDGRVDTILAPFLHFSFSKGLEDWIARHNRYSTREALLEFQSTPTVNWPKLFSMQRETRRDALRSLSRRLPFRPTLRFLYQFVVKRGFLEGRAGLKFSGLMATYEQWIVFKRIEIETKSLELPYSSDSQKNSRDTQS